VNGLKLSAFLFLMLLKASGEKRTHSVIEIGVENTNFGDLTDGERGFLGCLADCLRRGRVVNAEGLLPVRGNKPPTLSMRHLMILKKEPNSSEFF
jgi:hypothetical protein